MKNKIKSPKKTSLERHKETDTIVNINHLTHNFLILFLNHPDIVYSTLIKSKSDKFQFYHDS